MQQFKKIFSASYEIKLSLLSTGARQKKEIEALKASPGAPQKSSEHQQKWITTENLLLAVKQEYDQAILANYERLPTMFANRQEFDNFRKNVETKFLFADTFVAYKK